MSTFTKIICGTFRQLVILTGLAGLTFAAGIDWAEAAETGAKATRAVSSELLVIYLFLLTLGVLAVMVSRTPQRVKVRGRPEKRRTTRR